MERLRDLLDSALAQATFDVGRADRVYASMLEYLSASPTARVYPSGFTITHASRPDEVMKAQQLREFASRDISAEPDVIRARRAMMACPEGARAPLETLLRVVLTDYIDPTTDSIGHAFPNLGVDAPIRTSLKRDQLCNIIGSSTVGDFTRALVKGAALAGVDTAVSLLLSWIDGDPVQYRTSALLNCWNVREPLNPVDGVTVEPLPLSSAKLPAHLPQRHGVMASDYLGRSVVSVDTTASPALFRPPSDAWERTVKADFVPDLDIDTVCQAMSLALNGPVDAAFFWNDYEPILAFSHQGHSGSWSYGSSRLQSRPFSGYSFMQDSFTGETELCFSEQTAPTLTEERVADVLHGREKHGSRATQIATSRWMTSKDSGRQLSDQFIDLRIALEGLYLHDFLDEHSQEMRFRLPLFGAWHLGRDFKERRHIRKTLRCAYDTASQAVHPGKLAPADGDRLLLSETQDLCRRGILKLLREGPPPDWGELVLGRHE